MQNDWQANPNSFNQSPPPVRQRAPHKILLIIGIILVVVALIGGVGYAVWQLSASKTTSSSRTTPPPAPTSSTSSDTSSLQNDLKSINGDVDQSAQNLSSSDDALGDQQSQITVPTN